MSDVSYAEFDPKDMSTIERVRSPLLARYSAHLVGSAKLSGLVGQSAV